MLMKSGVILSPYSSVAEQRFCKPFTGVRFTIGALGLVYAHGIQVVVMYVYDLACEVTKNVAKSFLVPIRGVVGAVFKRWQFDRFAPVDCSVRTLMRHYRRAERLKAKYDLTDFILSPSAFASLRDLVHVEAPTHGQGVFYPSFTCMSQVRVHVADALEHTDYKIIPTSALAVSPPCIDRFYHGTQVV